MLIQHQSESVAAEINRKFIPKYQGLNIKDLLCTPVYKGTVKQFTSTVIRTKPY